MALQMPISRVRSVTDTSMMFMIPMPPTSSEMLDEPGHHDRHGGQDRVERLLELLGGLDPEIVLVVGLEIVRVAQQARDRLR